jgi:hypothetical protein
MTEDRLKELEALCEKATPGPWKLDYGNWNVEAPIDLERMTVVECHSGTRDYNDVECYCKDGHDWQNENCERNQIHKVMGSPYDDMDFIAEARTAIPGLIAEVRRLREALSKASDELGVTQPGYPSPVANANKFIKDALSGFDSISPHDCMNEIQYSKSFVYVVETYCTKCNKLIYRKDLLEE